MIAVKRATITVLCLLVLPFTDVHAKDEYKCKLQSDSAGKENKTVKSMGKKVTAQHCIDACVEEKGKAGGNNTNFVTYKTSTQECSCSVGELTIKSENGTQACFLVPKLPGVEKPWYQCLFGEGKEGVFKSKHFIGTRNAMPICKQECKEYRLLLFPDIDGISFEKSTKKCFCLAGQSSQKNKNGTANCKLSNKKKIRNKKCCAQNVTFHGKEYERCMNIVFHNKTGAVKAITKVCELLGTTAKSPEVQETTEALLKGAAQPIPEQTTVVKLKETEKVESPTMNSPEVQETTEALLKGTRQPIPEQSNEVISKQVGKVKCSSIINKACPKILFLALWLVHLILFWQK